MCLRASTVPDILVEVRYPEVSGLILEPSVASMKSNFSCQIRVKSKAAVLNMDHQRQRGTQGWSRLENSPVDQQVYFCSRKSRNRRGPRAVMPLETLLTHDGNPAGYNCCQSLLNMNCRQVR